MFKIPYELQEFLNNKRNMPSESFINNSTYYSQVDYAYINYMNYIVRPCIAYGSGVSDFGANSRLSSNIGKSIVDGATRLVIGDKVFFEGDDKTVKFFSDVWQNNTNFLNFLMKAERFKFLGGTSICKINTDENGRNYLTAFRLDRTLPSFDDNGNITSCIFFISLLSELKKDLGNQMEYWLVEDRHYNKNDEKVIEYKVFCKSGIAQSPVLPSPYQQGIDYNNLPKKVRRELDRLGIKQLNAELILPYRDKLGIWAINTTATNSCIPDAPFGDPLLFGSLDLMWSIDVVYSGLMTDVLHGESKIIVPKQFLEQTMRQLKSTYPGTSWDVTTAELSQYGDETFVYVMPSGFDKEKQAPLPVQFDIRAEKYTIAWELFQKEAVVRSGFSPTSIFPHLTPDSSAKTATEITAEENLTRASIRQSHLLDIPIFNKMLREIAFQEGLDDNIELKLSDYIGNKLQFDDNMRQNVSAGLVPREIAVQQINNLSASETADYMQKISEDNSFNTDFNDKDYFGESGEINENSEPTA